jgi:hypothetical protein
VEEMSWRRLVIDEILYSLFASAQKKTILLKHDYRLLTTKIIFGFVIITPHSPQNA